VGHLANWRSKASQIPAGQAGFIVAVPRSFVCRLEVFLFLEVLQLVVFGFNLTELWKITIEIVKFPMENGDFP